MSKINETIEHTLLRVDSTEEDVKKLCDEAIRHNFAGICVIPYFVKFAREYLDKQNTKVKVVTVVGFPFGYNSTAAKVEECKRAINDGADEIDMVMNISAFKDKNYNYVKNDIQSVATFVNLQNKVVKVIIESGLLTDKEIVKACEICEKADVNFVKTSTGFNGEGASVQAVETMRKSLPAKIKIKASGGIKTKTFAAELIKAGASRIGTSSGVTIIEG